MGNWIAEERARQDITQEELGKYAGISGAGICKIETGASRPSLPVLYHIANRLGRRDLADELWPFVMTSQAEPPRAEPPQEEQLFEIN